MDRSSSWIDVKLVVVDNVLVVVVLSAVVL